MSGINIANDCMLNIFVVAIGDQFIPGDFDIYNNFCWAFSNKEDAVKTIQDYSPGKYSVLSVDIKFEDFLTLMCCGITGGGNRPTNVIIEEVVGKYQVNERVTKIG